MFILHDKSGSDRDLAENKNGSTYHFGSPASQISCFV